MKELFLVEAESTTSSLVLVDHETNEQFFLVVTPELRDTFSAPPATDSSGQPETPAQPTPPSSDADTHSEESEHEHATEDAPAESEEAVAPTKPVHTVDPRLSAPLKMAPREIQTRIRSGASIAELAAENDVPESRIEPYAHPIFIERAHIAKLAKSSHPVREDGPARLTLWEVLATAFAARNLDLSQSEWDAYRDPANQWVVQVKWMSGINENIAEWNLLKHNTSHATTIARNGLAADLIDPNFAQPVRSLSAIATARTTEIASTEEQPEPVVIEEAHGEDLLQHPDTEQMSTTRRRRKAVTPHWEDVLLGVRSNTKRPRK
ncbi:septation protein SepH [Corynebacterium sp. HS2168-gen11]|uniref:septation protein SepH n=1 Tax=Corynebacterium sp. HS2168-gen11 TaxID=2974027 RepID=UPI00216ACFD5|nr:septation protein SepH [Corynebacterium sp. HS2168-gen11]MCS4536442.1 septation protein SepH [Corynebacterium sp. HS2168-gen11]